MGRIMVAQKKQARTPPHEMFRKVRLKAGWSQTDAGYCIGKTQVWVSQFERGNKPSVEPQQAREFLRMLRQAIGAS